MLDQPEPLNLTGVGRPRGSVAIQKQIITMDASITEFCFFKKLTKRRMKKKI